MSELINTHDNRATIRWKLLTGASALALAAYAVSATVAMAEDSSQPLVWIELGGQFERQSGLGHTYSPPFMVNNPDSPAFDPVSPLHWEKPPIFSEGLQGAVTFQPQDSDWQFSASIRYGRSGGRKRAKPGHEITHTAHGTVAVQFTYATPNVPSSVPRIYYGLFVPTRFPIQSETIHQHAYEFAPIQVDQKQTHEIIDFMAGKDVGLGLFGRNATGTISAGVRIAQFRSSTSAVIHARPDAEFFYTTNAYDHYFLPSHPFRFPHSAFHTYAAQFEAQREFRGVGPSISWNSSVPVAGNSSDETLTIDWGINAALLFGKQRARGIHQTSGHFRTGINGGTVGNIGYYTTGGIPFDRSKRVTIPNVGGMLGMSVKFQNAKISIGYRGDFFFGAMDTGVDTRRTGRTGFYGPFATISIGLP